MIPEKLIAELKKRGLEDSIISELSSRFHVRTFTKGEFFAAMGSRDFPPGFVLSGLFYEYITGEDGKVFVHEFIGPGQFLSCSFRWGKTSPAYLECLKKSEVLVARYKDVAPLLERSGVMNRVHEENVDDCLQNINNRLAGFATMEASGRYELFLRKYGDLAHIIPQYLVASYLGVTPTQLSRIKRK